MTGILIIMNVFIHPWTLGNLTVKYLSINSNYPWNLSHGRNVASTISAVSNKKCYRLSYCKFSLLDISMQINHAKFLSFLEKYYSIFSVWMRISQSKYLTIIWNRTSSITYSIPRITIRVIVRTFAFVHGFAFTPLKLSMPCWNFNYFYHIITMVAYIVIRLD